MTLSHDDRLATGGESGPGAATLAGQIIATPFPNSTNIRPDGTARPTPR